MAKKESAPMMVSSSMSQPAVVVHETTTMEEVTRIMLEKHIGGVPVVNEQGKLSGIITESDFAAKEQGFPCSTGSYSIPGSWHVRMEYTDDIPCPAP